MKSYVYLMQCFIHCGEQYLNWYTIVPPFHRLFRIIWFKFKSIKVLLIYEHVMLWEKIISETVSSILEIVNNIVETVNSIAEIINSIVDNKLTGSLLSGFEFVALSRSMISFRSWPIRLSWASRLSANTYLLKKRLIIRAASRKNKLSPRVFSSF